MKPQYLVLFFVALFAFACGEADSPTDKGEEENALTDGKSDSFFKPTEHGQLRFGTRNPGTIDEDALFHAWTFELTDDAEVDLRTEISANLDTVMYLYRREPGAESWGRFHRKNDDDGDKVSSRITLDAAAGEYRVVVKGFKSALRGSFNLTADCTGAGCEAPDSGECSPDEFDKLPTSTPYTASCAFDIHGVLNSQVVSQAAGSTLLRERCDVGGIELVAINHYHEWWDDIAGFDDLFRFDPDEDVELFFETTVHRMGTVVNVDAGGDEDAMTFIFDADDRLLSSYQHNQSPTLDFYCGLNSEAPIEGPGEDCFTDVMFSLPRKDESSRISNTVLIETAGEVHPALGVAARQHARNFGLLLDTEISYDLVTWRSVDGVKGAEATIAVDDASVTYYVHDDRDVRMEQDPNEARFICD